MNTSAPIFKQIGDPISNAAGTLMPISAGIELDGIIYLSGVLPMLNGKILGEDIETQTDAVMDNVEQLLIAENLSFKHVFKVSCWLTRKSDFVGFNTTYSRRVSEPFPVRTTVISELVVDGALLEMEFLALRP